MSQGFHVFCTDDGVYVLATRMLFMVCKEAVDYAETCAPSRDPIVIPRWEVVKAATDYYLCGDVESEFKVTQPEIDSDQDYRREVDLLVSAAAEAEEKIPYAELEAHAEALRNKAAETGKPQFTTRNPRQWMLSMVDAEAMGLDTLGIGDKFETDRIELLTGRYEIVSFGNGMMTVRKA